jgi:hypothetical protein
MQRSTLHDGRFEDEASSDESPRPTRTRARLRPWSFLAVATATLVLALPLHLDVSWAVVAFAVLASGAVAAATRMGRLTIAILVTALVIAGGALMELDNVVQYATWKVWTAPSAINSCGVAMRQVGVEESLVSGDAPPLEHIWTTPAGAYIYGYPGCPGTLNGLIVAWHGRFLIYSQ